MVDGAQPGRVRRLLTAFTVALIVAVAVIAVVSVTRSSVPEPMAISATGPRFASITEMFEASDVVVEATVIAADDGRTITDPVDPDAGLSTRLFQLEVSETFRGDAARVLIVEQESELLDGTPIIVNGMEPNQLGDTGFWFLVRGVDEQFPYVAVINEQGRLLIDGERLRAVDVASQSTVAQLRMTLNDLAATDLPSD